MSRRYTYEEVESIFIKNNLKLLENEYKNENISLKAMTVEGYIVLATVKSLIRKSKVSVFHLSNPYTLENIKLWLLKNNSIYKLKEEQIYKGSKEDLILICPKCGEFERPWHEIQRGYDCSYCTNKLVKIGYNDMATTRPELVKYFKNKKDVYRYTKGSNKKVELICPDCGFEKPMRINVLMMRGFSCNQCSDGYSLPNRFSVSLFNQLNIDFKPEKIFKNSNYRYDMYIKNNKNKYVLEQMGIQHYEPTTRIGARTLKEEQENDKNKRLFAKSLGVIYIEIDCRKSTMEYLKFNFIKSLSLYFNLSNVDWNKVWLDSQKSLVIEACKIRKDSSNTKTPMKIAKELKLNRNTIARYLKIGDKLGLCKYNGKEKYE